MLFHGYTPVDHFHLFVLMTYAVMNISIQVDICFHFSGIYLGVELLCQMVTLHLTFWGTIILFSKVPLAARKGSNVSTYIPLLVIVFFFILAILVEVKWYLIGIWVWLWCLRDCRGGGEMTYSRSGPWRAQACWRHWTPGGGCVVRILLSLWFLLIFRPCFFSLSTESVKHKSFYLMKSSVFVFFL